MAATIVEFEKAVARLKQALDQPKNDFIRDSVIQRFEFCVELAWKSARRVLGLVSTAPRIVIRDLARENLIRDPEVWFGYLEARNESSHAYDEALAEKVYEVARSALPEFQRLAGALKTI